MAIKVFDTWEEAVAQAKVDSNKVLKRKAEKFVETILRQHIVEDIYNAYTPKENGWVNHTTYKRRWDLPRRIESFYPEEGDLLVTSTEEASPAVIKGCQFTNHYAGSFLEMLASGHVGIWRGGFARPAVELAQEDIDSNPKMNQAIEEGIRAYMGEFEII